VLVEAIWRVEVTGRLGRVGCGISNGGDLATNWGFRGVMVWQGK
jgi:hypothetical protein